MQKIFDSHFHIIDPQFPLVENQGFLPDPYTVTDYREELQMLGLDAIGGAVVSASFQGYDATYFADALPKLGKNFVGVMQLPEQVTNQQIDQFDQIGIKHMRFNLYRGLMRTLDEIERQANQAYDRCGWKTEIYLDLSQASEDVIALLKRLPAVSIDHLGMNVKHVDQLRDLLACGIPVRVCGFGRVAYSSTQMHGMLPLLYAENPHGLIFATDLPSTRARYRFCSEDMALIDTLFSGEARDRLYYQNGLDWYLT